MGKMCTEARDMVDKKEDMLVSGGMWSVSGKVRVVGVEGMVETVLCRVSGGERVVEMEWKWAIHAWLCRDAYKANEVSAGA